MICLHRMTESGRTETTQSDPLSSFANVSFREPNFLRDNAPYKNDGYAV